jgi:hypothetical protein
VESGDSSILKSLWVRNSSVFLSNCTVWVEGITDRLYIKKYLELYQKSNQDIKSIIEDIDFSFVEYWGWNITHRSFLDDYWDTDTIEVERLCWKLMLIADNDNGKAKARKEELSKKLWDNFIELSCVEIENTLTIDTIQSIVKDYEWDTVVFKDTEANILNMKMWIFIQDHLLQNTPIRRWWYKDDSWTIKAKVDFCQKAISKLHSYDEISEVGKELTEKVYNFILEQKVK